MATHNPADCTETTIWNLLGSGAVADGDTVRLPSNLPTSGNFTLTVKTTAAGSPQTTANIAWNASAATVKARLEALPNVAAMTDGIVTVAETGRFEWKVTFPLPVDVGVSTEWSLPLMTVGTSSVTSASGSVDITINKWVPGFKGTINKVKDVQRIAMGSKWDNAHILSKQIILVGGASSVGRGGESIILNNLNGDTANSAWILFNLVFNRTLEIDGVTWRNGTSPNAGDIDKHDCLQFQGQFKGSSLDAYQLNIHHCRFEQMRQYPIFTDCVRGCVHHNVFYQCEAVAYTYNRGWQPTAATLDTQNYGDGSWAWPTNPGKFDAMYYEDNIYDQGSTGASGHPDGTFHDGTTGGRLVIRHNTMTQNGWTYGSNGNPVNNNAALCTCHGTEGRKRSIRHLEYYNNYITQMNTSPVTKQRGGTMIIFNNRVLAGGNRDQQFQFQQDNQGDAGYFGRSSGTNPVHKNDPGPYSGAWGGITGPANTSPPFFVGVISSHAEDVLGESGVKVDYLTCTKSVANGGGSPGWTANQWKGYSMTVTSPNRYLNGSGSDGLTGGYFAEVQRMGGVISANSANVLQVEHHVFTGGTHVWANNDQIRIDRCLQSIDMAGTGSVLHAPPGVTSLVTGGAASIGTPNSAVLPSQWNNQTLEPCYEWNNVRLASVGAPVDETITYQSNTFPQIRPTYNYKTGVMPGYPVQPTTPAAQVCGADIASASGKTTIAGTVYGAPYPHPLVSATPPPLVPILSIPANHDFGNVAVTPGSSATFNLEIFNVGGATLTVTSMAYAGAPIGVFTGYTTPSFNVAAGDSVIKTIIFTPAAITSYSGTVTLDTNTDASGSDEIMELTGVGITPPAVPVISMPASHASGNIGVNQPDTFNIPVSNIGGALLTISSVSYPTNWTGNTGSFTVAGGATVNLAVTFTPTAAIAYSGTITVVSNTDHGVGTVGVTGTGVTGGSGPGHGKRKRKNVLISRF